MSLSTTLLILLFIIIFKKNINILFVKIQRSNPYKFNSMKMGPKCSISNVPRLYGNANTLGNVAARSPILVSFYGKLEANEQMSHWWEVVVVALGHL